MNPTVCKLKDANCRLQLSFACIFALISYSAARAQPFSFDDIQYWVGAGANRAALVIDWSDTTTAPPALVWGYRWNGTATGRDMLTAAVANDPRLFVKFGDSAANPIRVYGLGYDANNDGQFAISDATTFDAGGFEYTPSPPDVATSVDPGDYYAEGWFTGFWHYGVAASNPYGGSQWQDAGAGMASRMLADGAWDSWVYSPTFNFASFATNPTAAKPPYPPGDYNLDGRVDAADYDTWKGSFGSTTKLPADSNHNGIVDAADYVVWRDHFTVSADTHAAFASNVPEPASVGSMLIAFTYFLAKKRKRTKPPPH